MKFVALIYGNDAERMKWPEAQQKTELEGYFAYDALLTRERALVCGEALVAKHVKGGQLLGLYLHDVPSRQHALELAAKCPGATTGAIEVRAAVPV